MPDRATWRAASVGSAVSTEALEKLDEAAGLYDVYLELSRINEFPSVYEAPGEDGQIVPPIPPLGLVLTSKPIGLQATRGSR